MPKGGILGAVLACHLIDSCPASMLDSIEILLVWPLGNAVYFCSCF